MEVKKVVMFIVIFIILILIGNILLRWGLPIKVVKLNSEDMVPTYRKGDALIYKAAESIIVGDVIIIQEKQESSTKNQIITRVVAINDDRTYKGIGDANNESLSKENSPYGIDEASITRSQVTGEVIFGINQFLFYIITTLIYLVLSFLIVYLINSKVLRHDI